jgi:GR25 family glycosyltransferase involved in LPS biosynthesis
MNIYNMITINYKNTIINYNNKLEYQINLENNNQEVIVIKNLNKKKQIQFKLFIDGYKNLNIDDKKFDVDSENYYIVSFILEENQEANLIFNNRYDAQDRRLLLSEFLYNDITLDPIHIDKVYIINLKRRSDRKKLIIKELAKVGIKNYEFINAVDGNDAEIKEKYKKLKKNKSKIKSAGHLGCLLSHKKVLKKAYSDNFKQVLILEDDIFFKSEDFTKELQNLEMCPWKIIFLGAPIADKKIFINKWAFCSRFPGTYGYLIKRELIGEVLNYIKNMDNCIDLIFMKTLQKKDYCFILNDFILTDIKDSDTSKKKQVFQKYIDNLNKE